MKELWIAIALEYWMQRHIAFCISRNQTPIIRAEFFGHNASHEFKISALQFMRII